MSAPTRSSGNVFTDLGYDDEEAALRIVKASLLSALARHVSAFDTQALAAANLGVSQPRVSEIVNGRLSKFTTDMLLKLCHRAGIDVSVAERNLAAA